MTDKTQEAYTPLDQLRHILAEFAPSDEGFLQRLSHKMGEIRKNSLIAIAESLKRPGASALRKAVLKAIPKYDWPEWAGVLYDVLSKEQELAVFDEGCAALGALGTKSSWKALQRLKTVRTDRDRQLIVNRELNNLDTHQPIAYFMGRLMEGENNPQLSAGGARMISVVAAPQDIPTLVGAFGDGDKLVKKLVLRIIPCIQCPETENFLIISLKTAARDLMESKALKDLIRRLAASARPQARADCQAMVVDQYRELAGGLVSDLNVALGQQDGDPGPLFDALQEVEAPPMAAFLLESLRLLVEGKFARFSVFLNEREEDLEKSDEDTTVVLDCAASALERLVKEGGARREDVLPFFRDVFAMRLGGNVFLDSYAGLVSHEDAEILDEFLKDPEYQRRFVLIDAVGAKEDERFIEFFLRAAKDSIVDVGQRAIQHLGRLHKGRELFLEYFASGDNEKMRMAIWGFREIRMVEAGDILLEFVIKDLESDSVGVKNDLLIEAANTLAALRIAQAVPVFMKLLHDGQPLKMQVAMAEALAALELPDAALALLSKSKTLRHAEVLFIALEGCLPPFGDFEHPFPQEHWEELGSLLDRCAADQHFRALCAMEHLYILDLSVYEKLLDRMSTHLSIMRTKENWDKAANDRLSAISKDIAKRCESLKLLNQKEGELTTIMQRTAPKGSLRTEALTSLRDKLGAPDLIIKAEMARAVSEYVQAQLKVQGQEWRDVAALCEIAGICRQKDLIDPIKVIYARATGLGLKSAARNALLKLGLSEAEINRRDPIETILVLEPSAFFRKRLVDALKDEWKVRDASTMEDAEKLLGETAANLLVTEVVGPEAGMLSWLQAMWDKHRIHYVYICTSNRDLSKLGEPPWLIGVLYKPFPMEKLVEDIRG